MISIFESNVIKLAIASKSASDAKAELDAMRQALEESDEWQRAQKRLDEAKELQDQLAEDIKAGALDEYATTGDKKPHPAVQVKLFSKLQYDEQQAYEYCLDSLPQALKLDKRTFEQYAKGVAKVAPVAFVETVFEPRAQIASDLSEYLPVRDRPLF